MIYFTSDLHLFHNKEFIYADRGFETVEDMNARIIEEFNKVVTPTDELFLLGDCCMGKLTDSIPLLQQINGIKYLILGNHDTDNRIAEYEKLNIFKSISFAERLKYKKYTLFLSHYPTLVGNSTKDKVWNLHGHTHQKYPLGSIPGCYNVGVDAHNCRPVSIEKVYEEISS